MKAIIYTRFSPRPNASECDSCERQAERCYAYCKLKGYDADPEVAYSDPDTSGGVLERLGLRTAIQRIGNSNEEIVLVVDSVDRLSRDMLVTLTICHEIERAGGTIEYANGTQISDTPEGKLFGNILSAFAAYERDRIRYATSRGMKRRQANGEFFGKPPVGWMRDPENSKKLIECTEEQQAIREIERMRAGPCLSAEGIALRLTELGLFRGKPWSARTVRKIIAEHKEKLNED